MRRRRVLMAISALMIILTTGPAYSDVNWIHDTDSAESYAFLVDMKKLIFSYPPENYFIELDQGSETKSCLETSGTCDPFNSVAKVALLPFGNLGNLEINAMAMGPDQDAQGNPSNPPGGLKVQACIQTIPESLNLNHGIMTQQKVIAWCTRWFTVDESTPIELMAELEGNVSFDEFSKDDACFANKSVCSDVTLEARAFSDTGEFSNQTLAFLKMTPEAPTLKTSLTLQPTDTEGQHITYQLKGRVILEANISNLRFEEDGSSTIVDTLEGTFDIGTMKTPMSLTATVTKTTTDNSDNNNQDPQGNSSNTTTSAEDDGGGGGCFIDASNASHHQKRGLPLPPSSR